MNSLRIVFIIDDKFNITRHIHNTQSVVATLHLYSEWLFFFFLGVGVLFSAADTRFRDPELIVYGNSNGSISRFHEFRKL